MGLFDTTDGGLVEVAPTSFALVRAPERPADPAVWAERLATPTPRMYYACMPNVQVRDVPDEVHEALVRRAERAGQSLQQFLALQLAAIAATPTMEEILDRIERRPKGELSAKAAIDALDEERARR